MCIVDVFADATNGLFLSLSMVPADQQEQGAGADQFAEQVTSRLNDPQSLEVISAPLWYVYSPETALMSLARPAIEVRPRHPQCPSCGASDERRPPEALEGHDNVRRWS